MVVLCGAAMMMVISLLGMVGLLLHVPLWNLIPSRAVMVFGTAACIFIISVALLLRQGQRPVHQSMARGLGAVLLVFVGLTLFEYLARTDLHIDLASLHRWLGDQNPSPGRVSPTASVALLLVGVALVLPRYQLTAVRLRHGLAACVLMLGVLGVVAEFSGVGTLLSHPDSVKLARLLPLMALPPALCFGIAAGILLLQNRAEAAQLKVDQPVPGELSAYAFVGAAVTILLTVALLSYSSIVELRNRAAQVDHGYAVRATFDQALADYQNARGFWRRYVVRGDSGDDEALQEAVTKARMHFDEVLKLTLHDDEQQRMLRQMLGPFTEDLDNMRMTAAQKRQPQYAGESGGLLLLSERPLQAEWLDAHAREFTDHEEATLAALKQSSQRSMDTGVMLLLVGNAVGFGILAIALSNLVYSLQQRARLERQLRTANDGLEARIIERTTQLSIANNNLELLNATLEQRVKERTADLEDFSYTVSHDLRAPLRAIDGYSMILQEDQAARLDDEGRRMLQRVRDYGQRMGRLIDDLLRMSRLGRQSLNVMPLDMEILVRDVWHEALADTALASRENLPQLELHPLLPAAADLGLLRQVWVNLISNAIKYSAQVARPVVSIGSRTAEGDAVYFVRDNGAGFDMAHAGKLFGVFQRLHRSDEFAGTGVGLAIVERVVRRHGGRVWAEGQPGSGATFYFTLPLSGDANE